MFNPWNGNSLRKYTKEDGSKVIYGPANGSELEYYGASDIDPLVAASTAEGEADRWKSFYRQPKRLAFDFSIETGLPLFDEFDQAITASIAPGDPRMEDSIWARKVSETDNIEAAHDATIAKWIERAFMVWVNAEKAARK